jgi:hypothetical protein
MIVIQVPAVATVLAYQAEAPLRRDFGCPGPTVDVN